MLENVVKIKHKSFLIVVTALCSLGIGALFEIVELLGILLLNNKGVSDYFNNAFDLVSNSIGILIASIVIILKKRK